MSLSGRYSNSIHHYIQRHSIRRTRSLSFLREKLSTIIDHYKMGQCVSKCFKPTILSDSASIVVDEKFVQTTISSEISVATAINKNYFIRSPRVRIIQNFTLLWLDSNIDQCDADFENSFTQLRRIINTIDTFTDLDQCVDFLTQIKNEKAFMLVSGDFSQLIVPLIHDMSQLDSIYVFCTKESKYEQWATEWRKVKGVFTQIEPICAALKRDTQQCNHDSILISVTSKDLNHLEPSFMYTQLLKETLLGMEYDNKAKTELVGFCRDQFHGNPHELKFIDEFERDYQVHTPIWWYTCECFTYQMLNRALRIQDVEIIIKMGFFLRDVHRQIEELHSKIEHRGLFIVYRGQGMSNNEFELIRNNKGGLLAFNNFLSTSLKENVSLEFARSALYNRDSVGILFQMTINPSISSAPFASLDNVSYYQQSEKEILFSMHTVFRIGQMKLIEDRMWQVELALASDSDDRELKRLIDHMRMEIKELTGWDRLGELLVQMGNFDKAEEIYQMLLEEASNDDEKKLGHIYHQLGWITYNKGDYKDTLEFYQKALKIRQIYLSRTHPDFATTYNNIGLVHYNQRRYSDALEFYQKALSIREKSLPVNHLALAATYNNIGLVYDDMGEYLKAFEFYQKAIKIREQFLPPNHRDLAITYNNIGIVHDSMGEHSKALDFYQKTIEIYQKSLSPNHPYLANIYNNISQVHCSMGEHSRALSFSERAVQIGQQSLPENHPLLQSWQENLDEIRKCN